MKYIVYLTLNLKNNKKYIGVHKTENPDVFDGYLGNGCYRTIPSSYKKSKTAFQYALNKYGVDSFKRITLAVFDDEESAYMLESHLVTEDFIRRKDVYNISIGGNHTDIPIQCYQYDFYGNYIRSYKSYKQAAELNNCSRTIIYKAVLYKQSAIGYLWTNFYIKKLNIKEFNFVIKKFIYEYDKNGNYIQRFDSTSDIVDKYGINLSTINRAIAGQYSVLSKYYSFDKVDHLQINEKKSIKDNIIYLYDLSGNFFREFNNTKECASFFGDKDSSYLISCYRLGRNYKGYQISLEKVPFLKNLEIKTAKKPILKYDLDGNFIKEYPSITEAVKEYGNGVSAVLKGQQSHCHHFIFKYKKS